MRVNKFYHIIKQYMYYGIAASLAVFALIFLPLLDTSGRIDWGIPETSLGWIAYIAIRVIAGVVTFLIFVSFDCQGKINIQDDPRYVEAYNKLYSYRNKIYIPISPKKYMFMTRGVKGVTTALSSIITAFIVISCVLSYNYNILLAYGITIGMSIITGFMQMAKTSAYWTEEFPQWVNWEVDRLKALEAETKEIDSNDNN